MELLFNFLNSLSVTCLVCSNPNDNFQSATYEVYEEFLTIKCVCPDCQNEWKMKVTKNMRTSYE
jgi:hypothetical protein